MKEYIITDEFLDDLTKKFASAQGQLKELVHCEDCKHWTYQPTSYWSNEVVHEEYLWCQFFKGNEHCAKGERREE